MKLNEGLRPNDLRGMLNNIVSVDEYESKIDASAVVITFSVTDRHAAQDANRFIQKSYVDLLDSEVSAAPDQNGDYLVFVEIAMNKKSADAVAQLCDDLASLGDIQSWNVRVRGADEVEGVPQERIAEIVRQNMQENLEEFFSQSEVTKVLVESKCVVESHEYSLDFDIQDFGDYQAVASRNNLTQIPVDFSIAGQRLCPQIKNLLGPQWSVEKLGEHVAVRHDASNTLLLMSNSAQGS